MFSHLLRDSVPTRNDTSEGASSSAATFVNEPDLQADLDISNLSLTTQAQDDTKVTADLRPSSTFKFVRKKIPFASAPRPQFQEKIPSHRFIKKIPFANDIPKGAGSSSVTLPSQLQSDMLNKRVSESSSLECEPIDLAPMPDRQQNRYEQKLKPQFYSKPLYQKSIAIKTPPDIVKKPSEEYRESLIRRAKELKLGVRGGEISDLSTAMLKNEIMAAEHRKQRAKEQKERKTAAHLRHQEEREKEENERINSLRGKAGGKWGILGANTMPLAHLKKEIHEAEERERQEGAERRASARIYRQAMHEFNNDMAILSAGSERPGERVGYRQRLGQRHAFFERGVNDGKPHAEIIAEVRREYGIKPK